MPSLSAGSVSQIRSVSLIISIFAVLFFLVRSFNVKTQDISNTARQQFRVISHFTPWPGKAPQVTKVTSLFGEKDNDLYERAIRSHGEHDRVHGYDTRVFREKIVESYWSKPSLLLSVLVEELEKPQEQRTEWIMWISPDVLIINPQIPLDIFLPPQDFDYGRVLATRDSDGVNNGVFFLKVEPWSVRMLIEVLSIPEQEFGRGEDAARKALEKVLRSEDYRSLVFYQPRKWYNRYQDSVEDSESQRGDLLVHFHGFGGDKWNAMASTIAQTDMDRNWVLPLAQTNYEEEIAAYWDRLREAKTLLKEAKKHSKEAHVDAAYRRLQHATMYEADDQNAVESAITAVREATGIR